MARYITGASREQLDLLLTGDLYTWIIDGGGVLDRHVLA